MNNQLNLKKCDAIDVIIKQWQKERPDIDVSPMGPIGRIKRCASLIERRLQSTFTDFDINSWEFDMLATLRRSGAPYCLSPTELFSSLMVTSGTMTHRLKQLETRDLIKRVANSDDARSTLVQLTDTGLKLINQAMEEHVKNEQLILSAIPTQVLDELDRHLSSLLQTLETTPVSSSAIDKI